MSVTESRYMKVRFTNGTERSFAFEPLTEKVDPSLLLSHIHKALDSRRLVMQAGNTLTIIPFDNIESIEVCPVSDKHLPEAIIVLHEFDQ